MRLRARLQHELRVRLAASLPEAMQTAWDHEAVVIAIEKLDFKPAGGISGDWENLTAFTGIVRAELRAEGVDALPVESLLADLIRQPLFVPEADVPPGALTETARCELRELRDTLTDMVVATGLRLAVSGQIVRRLPAAHTPGAVMLGKTPHVGPDARATYEQIGGAS